MIEPSAILHAIPWYAWIAIVGIVAGCVSSVVSAWFRHRERMAMIRQGMHPDLDDAKQSDAEPSWKSSLPEL